MIASSRTLLLVLFVFSLTIPLQAEDVKIPDKNLESVIREILKKKQIESPAINDAQLGEIYFLDARNRGIENLTGLEFCRNLAEIRLSKNQITDVAPLAGCLKVQSLDLAHNKIADVAPLAKLVKLQYLQLDDNQIQDIKPLAEIQALTSLYLSSNKVESIAPLAERSKLSTLYLANNQVTDLTPLSKLKYLGMLDLNRNQIQDLKPLIPLTNLRWTFLQNNKIQDIGPLVEMAHKDAEGQKRFAPFWKLYIGGNPLNEESKTKHVVALKSIGVRLRSEDKKSEEEKR